MTKKDYKAIADIIKYETIYTVNDLTGETVHTLDREGVIGRLLTYFQEDNQAFDRDKFLEAIKPVI